MLGWQLVWTAWHWKPSGVEHCSEDYGSRVRWIWKYFELSLLDHLFVIDPAAATAVSLSVHCRSVPLWMWTRQNRMFEHFAVCLCLLVPFSLHFGVLPLLASKFQKDSWSPPQFLLAITVILLCTRSHRPCRGTHAHLCCADQWQCLLLGQQRLWSARHWRYWEQTYSNRGHWARGRWEVSVLEIFLV